jgi:pimeloyl-ACP methyl ester carboxylesterase
VHFLHVRSPEPGALPLIITHGWPGSVVEFMKIIGPLTDPAATAATPPTPSTSSLRRCPASASPAPLAGPGWDTRRVAAAWAELMHRLGYHRYGAQGGDTGSVVSPELGRIDPDHVIGVHVNNLGTFPSGDPSELAGLSEADQARLALMDKWGRR